jgi:hypothetical protein
MALHQRTGLRFGVQTGVQASLSIHKTDIQSANESVKNGSVNSRLISKILNSLALHRIANDVALSEHKLSLTV